MCKYIHTKPKFFACCVQTTCNSNQILEKNTKYLREAVPLEVLTYTGGRLNPVFLAARAMPLLATSNS